MKNFLSLLTLMSVTPSLATVISTTNISTLSTQSNNHINSQFIKMQQLNTKNNWDMKVAPNGNAYLTESLGSIYRALPKSNNFNIKMTGTETATYSLFVDSNSNVYAYNEKNIYFAEANSSSFVKFLEAPEAIYINAFFIDKDNNIFIGCFKNSIYCCKAGSHVFEKMLSTDLDNSSHISSIILIANGDIYASDNRGFLYILKKGSQQFKLFKEEKFISTIFKLATDLENNLFFNDGYNNFRKLTPEGKLISITGVPRNFMAAFPLVSDSKGNIYTGTSIAPRNYIYVLKANSQRFVPYNLQAAFAFKEDIRNIAIADNNSLYVNTKSAIYNNDN